MGSVTKRLDVVAGRKYDSRGESKTHWINVGEAAEWDDGGITIRMHAMPVGSWWDGTLKLFEKKEREQAAPQRGGSGNARPARQQASAPADDFDDSSIPF